MTRSGTALLALLALGLAGCASEPGDTEPSTRPSTEATETPTPSTTQDPTPTEDPWERYTDERFPQSFEIPPGWSANPVPNAWESEGVYQIEVVNEAGERQLYFSNKVTGLGGACGEGNPSIELEELDSEPIDATGYTLDPASAEHGEYVAPHFSYRVAETDGSVVATLGLIDDVPQPSCFFYNLLHDAAGSQAFADTLQFSAVDAVHTFASRDEAQAYTETEEYLTLKRILTSYRFQ